MTTQQVTLDAQVGLTLAQNLTQILGMFIPAVAALGGPIGLGISAATALIPLIEQLKLSGTVSIEEQAALEAKVRSILTLATFSGPEWQLSGYVPPAPAAPAPPLPA